MRRAWRGSLKRGISFRCKRGGNPEAESCSSLTSTLDISLDGDSCKDDSRAGPLAGSEFVIVHDDGEEHRKKFPCQCERAEKELK